MGVRMDIAFAIFTTGIGAIKYRQVIWFQVWRIFQHHGTAYIVVGFVDLLAAETQLSQQVKARLVVLVRRKAEALQCAFAQGPYIKYKPDFES